MSVGQHDVLLLHPPITLKREDADSFGCYPPLGLAYLAAELERAGHNVKVVDLLVEGADKRSPVDEHNVRIGLSDEDIQAMLAATAPKIVGISNNFTAFSRDAVALAWLVRRSLPQALVVMGGAQATVAAESIVSTGAVDVVVLGEGEFHFRHLVELTLAGEEARARQLPATVWRSELGIINNGYPGPIADLDSLPMPAYHLLPMEKYIWQRHANFAVSRRWPIAHMITTRGCMYNCIFCSTTKLYKKFRPRSAESVLAEMKLLIANYGVREFHFHDDSFLSDPARVRLLCQRIIDEGLNVTWQVSQGINSIRLDEDLLELMHRSGMYRMGFPIESGDLSVLRFIRKPLRLEKVLSLIRKCNELGIYTFGCFMIGFPEETLEQISKTMQFMLDSGLDYAKISIVQPLAGSELYEVFVNHGLVTDTPRHGSTYWHTEYDTLYLTADQLNAMRRLVTRKFAQKRILRMLTPGGLRRHLLPKLRDMEHVRYFLRIMWLALRGI
ncbi:MAG: radical SAM protein [Humidesulfovibrio sp.]|nr:radical SAM protein [Humidesulfovibrio sp.]